MSEISHIASFQSQHSNYACPIKINPICTYGIDDEMMVIGFCFSCDDIAMLPLHDFRNSSTMPCHAMITMFQICIVLDVVNILRVMFPLMLMRRPPWFPHTY